MVHVYGTAEQADLQTVLQAWGSSLGSWQLSSLLFLRLSNSVQKANGFYLYVGKLPSL